MLNVAATEVKQRLGQYLESALTEPVVIEKSGRPAVVMLSVVEYERLCALEDAWWGEQARQAIEGGFAGAEETLRRLQERLNAEA
ncbi:MAG: type II toxin-antitoxin system Phd/YefM family antitoxin [Candidatus Competibacteraceae bacterium]|jgi:antitoxin Phd|nr:MAG: type II toxin-antitoxin system Phd/YefM family antitoxin [Candidatus Competibacteraceae bacterium]